MYKTSDRSDLDVHEAFLHDDGSRHHRERGVRLESKQKLQKVTNLLKGRSNGPYYG